MPLTFLSSGQKWSVPILVAAGLFPLALAAQDQPDTPETVQVALAGFTLEPERTETGALVLDEAGAPVMQRIALDDSVVTPGDQVLYVITVDNPTAEPAVNLQLGVQVAAELLLDPDSFIGPEGLVVEWAGSEELTSFSPIFVEIEGETVMNADLDDLRALRLTLPELPPAEEFSVEYTVTLR
ncbi:hypothetical protein [Roseinatronobacter monicus]|uniref:Putative repeat protein (TIGR01451 family) n=1 Tax=Roseinatronobacter monicus TaxID=393481 RepID=A0A543K4I0_9RHOB|nr:hypothetical protein [Roseinatronobacter monicus]TQM89980.1 putative repeat protein (TIGR01451 family) [Roseinatronobacter monicus]